MTGNFDWAYLFEISLTGIAGGGLYALAALAFVMVYKATRVVNIAIGELLMVGAYLFFTFASMFALPLWLAIPAAVLGTGLLGAVIERTMIRPLLGEPPISVFMVTVGLASVLVGGILIGLIEALAGAYLGGEYKLLATFIVLVAVLLVRPHGLFGTHEIERL